MEFSNVEERYDTVQCKFRPWASPPVIVIGGHP